MHPALERDEFFSRLDILKKYLKALPIDQVAYHLSKDEPQLADALSFQLTSSLMDKEVNVNKRTNFTNS